MKTYSFIVLLFLLSELAFAQNDRTSTITVSGTGMAKGTPDLTSVDIRIVEEDMEYQNCLDKAMKVMSSLIKSLKKAGFDETDLKTSNINVREKKQWQDGKEIKMGFQATASTNFEFQFSNKELKKVFDIMSDYHNKANYNVSFKLSDGKKERLVASAIKKAVADAEKNAGTIAEASGIELGAIVEIQYGQSASPVMYESAMFMSRAQSDTARPDVNPDEVRITENVMIRWAIK